MNNKLIIGVLIVLIFVFVILVPLYYQKKEDFTIYKYPNKLMAEHVHYINSKSNEYSKIFQLIDDIAVSVHLLYANDEDKVISAEIINRSIYEVLHERFVGIYNTINCSSNTENEECKLLKIVLQYFHNEYGYIENIPNITHPSSLEMNPLNDTDIENRINFRKITTELNKLYAKTIVSNINSFTKIRKELIIKKLVKNVLNNIFFTIYPSSVGGLACPIYTADSCPSIPYQQDRSDANSRTLPTNLREKYKCAIDKSFPVGKDNICVNSENNKYVTTNCEVMNGYGPLMCENTDYRNEDGTLTACKYENLTQKCVNTDKTGPEYLNTTKDSEGNYEAKPDFSGTKCHLIYNNDLDEMEKACSSQSAKCRFYKKQDGDGNNHGFCIANNQAERPHNFCLELSNINPQFAADMNCRVINKNNGEYFYSVKTSDNSLSQEEENLKCHFFDDSDEKLELGISSAREKLDDDKAFVKGSDNQKLLCEGLLTEYGDKKCQYVEYNKYIPSNHNSKYAKLNMCIPKDSMNVEAELIKDRESCKGDLYWSQNNGICLNLAGKCHTFKHKNVCNLYKHCLWQESDDRTDNNEYEYGYCRDLSSSLNRVEDLIDTIHQRHLENAVELKGIESDVSKLIPKFKNVLTSN